MIFIIIKISQVQCEERKAKSYGLTLGQNEVTVEKRKRKMVEPVRRREGHWRNMFMDL